MDDLLQMKLFSLLSETSQEVTNEQMHNAYGEFMEQLKTVSQSEQNHSETFRMLYNTRIELVSIKSHRYEQGGKCPKICLSSKSFISCQC